MILPRSRIGRAWTEWKPAASASVAKRGHRSFAVTKSWLTTGLAGAEAVQARAFLRLDLEELEHAHGLTR